VERGTEVVDRPVMLFSWCAAHTVEWGVQRDIGGSQNGYDLEKMLEYEF
jgi:hypothetical protein